MAALTHQPSTPHPIAAPSLGLEVWALGFGVWGSGIGVKGLGFEV